MAYASYAYRFITSLLTALFLWPLTLLAWRPNADDALALERATRPTIAPRLERDKSLAAFIGRVKGHAAYFGDGFVSDCYRAAHG